PGDAPGLRSALDQIMGDSQLRNRLASRAVDARERFSIEKIANMWEILFDQCMHQNADPGYLADQNHRINDR
ncbi:hypothetical protein ACFPM8_12170, partial [Paraherbaspirillum soli]